MTDYLPAIIFTTAFSEHALAAFEAQAIDYLLKPIRKERLFQALQKATQLNRAQLNAVHGQAITDHSVRSHLCIRQGDGIELVPVKDVCYFQADQKYVSAWANGQEYLIDESLKTLEQEFNHQFIRIHRNALVSRLHLTGIKKSIDGSVLAVFDSNEQTLVISRRHVAQVRKVLKKLISE